MNVEKNITIYVDGHPVSTKYKMRDGHMMVPFLFFKYAGVKVDMEPKNKQIVLKIYDKMLKLYVNGRYAIYYPRGEDVRQKELLKVIPTDTFLPLEYIAKKLGVEYQYDDKINRIYLITSAYSIGKPEVIYRAEIEENKVALTFNGLPDSSTASRLLEIFKDKNVKATFFPLGENIKESSKTLERIAKEGNEIGLFPWSNCELPKLTSYQIIRETKRARKLLDSIIKTRCNIFRPINGLITEADLLSLNEMGIRIIEWNINTADYMELSEEDIKRKLNLEVSPGSIILHNLSYNNEELIERSINILIKLIDELQGKDMKFVTVKELLDI